MHVRAGMSGEFRAGQVATVVLIWSGAFLLTCFAPLHLYESGRCALCYFFPEWSSVTGRRRKPGWPLNQVPFPERNLWTAFASYLRIRMQGLLHHSLAMPDAAAYNNGSHSGNPRSTCQRPE